MTIHTDLYKKSVLRNATLNATDFISILRPCSTSPHNQSLKVDDWFSKNVRRRHPRPAAVPDYLVACGAERRASGVGLRVLLRSLEDGAAVLLGRGLRRLPVLRHYRARLIWPIAVSKTRVRHPRWAARRSRLGGRLKSWSCMLGWQTERQYRGRLAKMAVKPYSILQIYISVIFLGEFMGAGFLIQPSFYHLPMPPIHARHVMIRYATININLWWFKLMKFILRLLNLSFS